MIRVNDYLSAAVGRVILLLCLGILLLVAIGGIVGSRIAEAVRILAAEIVGILFVGQAVLVLAVLCFVGFSGHYRFTSFQI